MKPIGELKHTTAFGLRLPRIGDIYESESYIDGKTYKCKVIKIKRLEWRRKWFFIKLLDVYLVVRVLAEEVE